jgi:hypothetical protein
VGPEKIEVFSPAGGLTFFRLLSREEPWAVHVLQADLSLCELGLRVLPALPEREGEPGRRRVTELVQGRPDVLAAVNGDFFTPEGLPLGTEVAEGRVVRRTRERPALSWRPRAEPWFGIPELEGDSVLRLGWRMELDGDDGGTEVVSGFPLLLRRGEPVGDLGVAERPSFAAARHPRTAVGYDGERKLLWLVVVDGRQEGYSDGMTLPELTTLLERLGAREAVNLDGGGSSVMVLRGMAVSRPSDEAGERPVANALGVRRDRSLCRR